MRLWGWRRRSDAGDEEYPELLDVSAVWDEQLSAHLDGELDEHEAAAVEEALAADPALEVRLGEFAAVRDALGSLGELRAPRPFTLEAPPTAARRAPGRLELVFRMGAVAAAVAFAIVFTGDIAGLGGEGVEGWGITRPSFGGGASEQASDAPAAAPAAARAEVTAAPATPVATQAATAAPTAQPTAAAEAAEATPTPQPTVAALAAATAEATATAPALAAPALPTVTRETRTAARGVESDEAAEAPAADTTPEPASGTSGASAEEAADATPEAAEAAEQADDQDSAEAAAPAAPTEATPAPAATAAPAIVDQPPQVEPQDRDAARALRRAEQGLLVAALALVGLTLLLGLWRRRGGAA